eukprot:TRINITY_DN6526_c0_g1_i1.p1 TRINITY_DN6526_c0_g1~~TRINITY_DN6526_c0_g1_i1.p1  ORF type:complete len:415 (+),score=68.67 TRINITY_DN6526_c0_g1_i1:76-1320(+)
MALRSSLRTALGRRFAKKNLQEEGEVIPHYPTTYPESKQVFLAGSGTDIASEEPIFGVHGYKPPTQASPMHYSVNDAFGGVTITSTKSMRPPSETKKVLPPPAKIVALTGCTSFQGTRIAKKLVESDDIEEVRLLTRYPDQVPADLQKVISINPEKCTLEEANVLDKASLNRSLQGCDSIVNAIDLRNDDYYNLHYDVYVKGTSNLCYVARTVGIKRYVAISGLDANFHSDSDYSDFRAKAEDMAFAENFYTVVMRPGHLYGDGYRYSKLGSQFYPTVYPNTRLQPTWVNDLADAVFKVLRDPHAVKRVIELGGPKVMTHMQFAIDRQVYHNGPKPFPIDEYLGDMVAFCNEIFNPNPTFSRSRVWELEMDQVARTKKENPHVWSWEDLGLTPATMEEASRKEKDGESFSKAFA